MRDLVVARLGYNIGLIIPPSLGVRGLRLTDATQQIKLDALVVGWVER
jgi:hypothetical protein